MGCCRSASFLLATLALALLLRRKLSLEWLETPVESRCHQNHYCCARRRVSGRYDLKQTKHTNFRRPLNCGSDN
jgi:hypothetical protein